MRAKRALKPPVYVDTEAALEKLVDALRHQPTIAVDTEANPLFAYREKLCLIQISSRVRDYIVDPLADIDIARLVPIFADPNIVKIFHDAEFDVLMLKRTLPIEIVGIFDTKVVAMSLGLEVVGLAPILKKYFDVTLDKRMQRSDWGQRPLTDGQLDYARYDTHFLIELADDLRDKLAEASEVQQLEVAAEFRRVEQLVPEERPFNPDDFTKVKGWDRLDPAQRRVLRELYVMRHNLADDLDRPAFKVLPSDALLKLARAQPTTMEALKSSRLLTAKLRERFGDDVLRAISRGQRLSPLPDHKIHRTKSEQDQLSEEQRGVYESLRNWRKTVAAKRETDASLVMPRSTMFALCKLRNRPRDVGALRSCGVLEPWRVDYYGEAIVAALNGSGGKSGRRRSRGRSRDTKAPSGATASGARRPRRSRKKRG